MAQILLFFTNDYPFGKDETFIENEMPILAQSFDKIIIISNDCSSKQTRIVPCNVVIERYSYFLSRWNLLFSIGEIFNRSFWQEINIIKTIYKKKRQGIIIKTVLQTLKKAKVFNKHIDAIIAKHATAYDQLFAYSYWADDTAYALTLLKKTHPTIKCFCRAHRWDIYFEENRTGYLPLRTAILEQLDAFYVISEHGKKYIEHLFSKSFPTIQVSRLGVPQHKRSPFDYKNFTIVSISNMIPVKNLEKLIEALATLSFNFTWYHIGDGPVRSELEVLAQKSIPGKFRYLGIMPNTEVLSFLETTPISVFINISLSEGVPVSIMEALSCGIPVIATNVGGNSEIVSTENGILIPNDSNEKEIAQALTTIHNLAMQECEQLRQNAYNYWFKEYNALNNYNLFIDSILSL
jgi:glycosyltransferase involved in cell wall biosynthesis